MNNKKLWGPFTIKGHLSFVDTIRKTLNQINRYQIGKDVFAQLQKTGKPCTIEYVNGVFNTTDFTNVTSANDPRIWCDPRYLDSKDFEPTIKTVRQRGMKFIYYFHEIVHCLHVASNYWSPLGKIEEEFRVTGLFRFENEKFSENAFRKVLRLPRRPVYVWSKAPKPGFLNAEKLERKKLGLPEAPGNYLKGIEDSFVKWQQWKRNKRRAGP